MNNKRKLLLIENDMADQASSFRLFLKRQNRHYALTCVTSLSEAEKYLFSEPFDLILLDHLLYRTSDVDISEFFQQIPVILIVENGNEDGGLKMMRQGIDDFLCRDREGKYCKLLSVSIKKALTRSVSMETQRHRAMENEPLKRLTAALAHDLCNMFSPILGFSTMLMDETEKNDPHFELIEEIHTLASRASNMVRQLSIFNEKDVNKFIEINLIDVLQNFSKVLQSTLGDKVSLDIRAETPAPPIQGDIALIEQAVMTLCLYFQETIHSTGKVRLSIPKARSVDEIKLLKEATCETYLVLKAEATTRAGEDEQFTREVPWHHKHLIESAEKKAEDPGLALVQTIVKQHGGFIRVERNRNIAGVELFFPVSGESLSRSIRPDADKTNLECSESILLVEGNLSVNNLITTVLQQKGYTVHTAQTDEEAYKIARQGQDKVDLLLADTAIVKPGKNRVFIALAKHNKAIKAMYMAPSSHQNFSLASAEQCIDKPFALNQLSENVRKTLDRRM